MSDLWPVPETEHVFLVACVVSGPPDRVAAERMLHDGLGILTGAHISEFWVAEDDRHDRSDNDSAVFVPKGEQVRWTEIVHSTPDGHHPRRWFPLPRKGAKR